MPSHWAQLLPECLQDRSRTEEIISALRCWCLHTLLGKPASPYELEDIEVRACFTGSSGGASLRLNAFSLQLLCDTPELLQRCLKVFNNFCSNFIWLRQAIDVLKCVIF